MLLLCLIAPIAEGQLPAEAIEIGPSAAGLRGLPNAGAPIAERELTLRSTVGYGSMGSRTLVPANTHRLQGGLAVGVNPLPWLGFGLRLDGRLELHGDDGLGAYISGFGDPRLSVRAGHALNSEWSVGGELLAWAPGSEAPSYVVSATSFEARVLGAYRPSHSKVAVLASFGGRLDNSAAIAPDRNRLRASDILTLGVSDSNAVLAAVGALVQVHPQVQAYAEFSGDLLVGAKAPRLSDSPLRVTGGARWALSEQLRTEATAVIALSTRPSLKPEAPWVPIEPRAQFLVGVSYTWSLAPQAPAPEPPAPPEPDKPEEPPPEPTPKLASLQGQIVDDAGQPVPDVHVTLQAEGGQIFESITDGEGRYQFDDVPYGGVDLEARAVGFATRRWHTAVDGPVVTPEAPTPLVAAADVGVLRGLVRSFDSKPLAAHVTIADTRGKAVSDLDSGDDGRVEVELPPGRYRVTIEAPGYRKQTQRIRIKGNGVSVLNADMRAQ